MARGNSNELAAARARWGAGLTPWERMAAMVAAGQLMRMGVEASPLPSIVGTWHLPRAAPAATAVDDHSGASGMFFQSHEQGDAEPTLVPTHALLLLRQQLQQLNK